MNQRIVEVDYNPDQGFTLRFNPFTVVPESARGHLITAQKEFVLALRSILDEKIARLEERERTPRRPRRVEVKNEEADAAE